MARIYKESRYVLQLLIGKSYVAQYEDVKISFYTKNPSNQVMADDDITIKGNVAEVMVDSTLFDNLEDGLISYIVYGTKDGIPFIEERQSNYFLKTPLDFKPTTCILEDKSVTPSMGDRNDDGYIIIEKSEGYDGLSRVVIDPQTLYNEGVEAGRAECSGPAPAPPQDGWGMTGYFNNWGNTPDIPFEENGEGEGRPYKVIRNFEAVQGEFKIRRNNAWTDSRTASFRNIPQFAKLIKGDSNMSINDGVWDIYLFFGNDGVPNEMLVLNPGTDLSTIQYEYTLNLSADKESAIFFIGDGFDFSTEHYYGGSATIPMKYGCIYSINVYMEGYEDIYEDITCYNDEERSYTLTKIEGGGCNLINPIVFSEDAGNTINAENVQIPTFVYEGNQYYNANSFNLADIEEFKIHILFKPNNSGDAEPINVFGCEDTDWDNTTFGARIYQGQIYFRMSGEDVASPYTENTWYDVEMGYNTTKKWVIVNGETLLDAEYASFNRPRQTLMIGAINSGGNAFRPFYGKIAAIYIESNGNQVWLLPKEDGTMYVYWNNRINKWITISGDNNARFENDYISGDGMKSITWLGNLEDKWVTPSMSERDDNGLIVVSPSEGYNGLKRTVINPQTLYNEGVEAGRAEGGQGGSCNLGVLDWTLTEPNGQQKNASDDGYDGYSAVVVRPENIIAQEKENAINDFKNKMDEITITENGTFSIDDTELTHSISFDGNSYFDTGIVPTENIKIEVCIKVTNGNDSQMGGIIIGGGIDPVNNNTENRGIAIGMGRGAIYGKWGAIKSWNKPYDYVKTTTVVLQKTDDSWQWDTEKGSFGASTLYIGGYNRNGEEVEEKFTQSIVYIKIWTDRNDDSTLITYTPKTNGNFDANGTELQRLGEGTATFVEENVNKYPYGFKRVEVNVIPKVNVQEAGIKLAYGTFTEVPEWADFEGITNMSHMFYECYNLQNIPLIDTSNVTDMYAMFEDCSNLQTIPQLNTSNVTNMSAMFMFCNNLQTIPEIDTSNVTNMRFMFSMVPYKENHLSSLPKFNCQKVTNISDYFSSNGMSSLTDVGGWENLKCNWDDASGLVTCPNLTRQSCINILNGLYDFVGNGSTETRTLKVHPNFLTTVGDEISIGTNKGWQITA